MRGPEPISTMIGTVIDRCVGVETVSHIYAVIAREKYELFRHLTYQGVSEESAKWLVDRSIRQITDNTDFCESPIEQIMLAQLSFMTFPFKRKVPVRVLTMKVAPLFTHDPCVLIPQFVIGPYRLDFLFRVRMGSRVFLFDIECDGHAYHTERVNLDRDTVRDVFMQQLGIVPLRFSGSKINKAKSNNHLKCELQSLIDDTIR